MKEFNEFIAAASSPRTTHCPELLRRCGLRSGAHDDLTNPDARLRSPPASSSRRSAPPRSLRRIASPIDGSDTHRTHQSMLMHMLQSRHASGCKRCYATGVLVRSLPFGLSADGRRWTPVSHQQLTQDIASCTASHLDEMSDNHSARHGEEHARALAHSLVQMVRREYLHDPIRVRVEREDHSPWQAVLDKIRKDAFEYFRDDHGKQMWKDAILSQPPELRGKARLSMRVQIDEVNDWHTQLLRGLNRVQNRLPTNSDDIWVIRVVLLYLQAWYTQRATGIGVDEIQDRSFKAHNMMASHCRR